MISRREYLEYYQKSIYEVSKLDYFTYLFLNHLGFVMLEYFRRSKRLQKLDTPVREFLLLLGSRVMNFLSRRCFGTCPVQCLKKMDESFSLFQFLPQVKDSATRKLLRNLAQFSPGPMTGRQCFQIDFMNSVILDTLISWYEETFRPSEHEENYAILDLAEFIQMESLVIIETYLHELLEKPNESGLSLFDAEDSQTETPSFTLSQNPVFRSGLKGELLDFIDAHTQNNAEDGMALESDLRLFTNYLSRYCQVSSFLELTGDLLLEFMSFGIINQVIFETDERIAEIFNSLAVLVEWLGSGGREDLRTAFLSFYEGTQLNSRRVLKALNQYLITTDQAEKLLEINAHRNRFMHGWFIVDHVEHFQYTYVDLRNLKDASRIPLLKIHRSIGIYLEKGDILELHLAPGKPQVKLFHIHHIFPHVALPFVLRYLRLD